MFKKTKEKKTKFLKKRRPGFVSRKRRNTKVLLVQEDLKKDQKKDQKEDQKKKKTIDKGQGQGTRRRTRRRPEEEQLTTNN